MALYGILQQTTERNTGIVDYHNTGIDTEIGTAFSTPLSVYSNYPEYVSETMSLRRFASSQNVQRWEIEANLMPSSGNPTLLLHMLQHSRSRAFKIRMPQVYVDRVESTGSKPIAGEFFNYSTHTKVYLCRGWTTGPSPVIIPYPDLPPEWVSYHATHDYSLKHGPTVTMLAYYSDETQLGIRYVDGVLSDPGSVKFVEAV